VTATESVTHIQFVAHIESVTHVCVWDVVRVYGLRVDVMCDNKVKLIFRFVAPM